jgi:PAS domain-containing protein
LRHDGEWRWLQHRANPLFNDAGRFEGYAGRADITELEEHRQQLVQANELYHSVVEAGPLWRASTSGRIIYTNFAWDEVLDNPKASSEVCIGCGSSTEQQREMIDRGRVVETGETFRIRVAPVESAHFAMDPVSRSGHALLGRTGSPRCTRRRSAGWLGCHADRCRGRSGRCAR